MAFRRFCPPRLVGLAHAPGQIPDYEGRDNGNPMDFEQTTAEFMRPVLYHCFFNLLSTFSHLTLAERFGRDLMIAFPCLSRHKSLKLHQLPELYQLLAAEEHLGTCRMSHLAPSAAGSGLLGLLCALQVFRKVSAQVHELCRDLVWTCLDESLVSSWKVHSNAQW